jgi:hypothetical protein
MPTTLYEGRKLMSGFFFFWVSCFDCIGALGVAGYNSTQWGDDCYEAYSQPAPQKSAAAAAVGVDRVIYCVLVMAAASMRLQHLLACTGL